MRADRVLAELGGIARANHLAEHGVPRAELLRSFRAGDVERVRNGWYALPGPHPGRTAVQHVGSLSCISAARHLGLWSGTDRRLHIARDRHRGRLPTLPAAVVDHQSDSLWPAPLPWLQDPRTVLAQLCQCQDRETAVAAVDSALHRGVISRGQLTDLRLALPRNRQSLLEGVDGRSESGLESIVRLRLRAAGITPYLQVSIPEVGRVDFLIGRVIVEVDGAEFHAHRFENDRARDAAASRRGYVTLRFSYLQVMTDWPGVLKAILGALRTVGASW